MIEIGDCEIETCEDCPGYTWNGEGSRRDHGYRCAFGAFDESHEKPERIHFDCPLVALIESVVQRSHLWKPCVCATTAD